MRMLAFFVGLIIGGMFGVGVMCLLFVAGQADEREERQSSHTT